MNKIAIGIIDNQILLRQGLKMKLDDSHQFEVVIDSNFQDFPTCPEAEIVPDIMLVHLSNPFINITDYLEPIREAFPHAKFIVIFMNADPDLISKLISRGIMGFLTRNSSHSSLTEAILEVNNGSIYRCPKMAIPGDSTGKNSTEFLRFGRLSRRELEIAKLLALGMTSREISSRLFIACKTVDVHRHNVYRKLKVKNIALFANVISLNALLTESVF